MGDINEHRESNFLVVTKGAAGAPGARVAARRRDSYGVGGAWADTPQQDIADKFKALTKRQDIAIVIINQHVRRRGRLPRGARAPWLMLWPSWYWRRLPRTSGR